VPEPVEKLAIWPIVPEVEALKSADARTEVKEPDAVNVLLNVVVLEAALCVSVVAIALPSPLVVISPVNVLSVTAGVMVLSVRPIKLTPTPPAEVLVKS